MMEYVGSRIVEKSYTYLTPDNEVKHLNYSRVYKYYRCHEGSYRMLPIVDIPPKEEYREALLKYIGGAFIAVGGYFNPETSRFDVTLYSYGKGVIQTYYVYGELPELQEKDIDYLRQIIAI